MRPKIKVGDTVLTIRNPCWGLQPMKVVRVSNRYDYITCKHPSYGTGAFRWCELRQTVSKARLLKIKELLRLKQKVKRLEDSLFGK